MYACIRETGGGFFGGVCEQDNRLLTFRGPPPPLGDSRIVPSEPQHLSVALLGAQLPIVVDRQCRRPSH